jgi:hypothetical protein
MTIHVLNNTYSNQLPYSTALQKEKNPWMVKPAGVLITYGTNTIK